jgi:hypothetical protein
MFCHRRKGVVTALGALALVLQAAGAAPAQQAGPGDAVGCTCCGPAGPGVPQSLEQLARLSWPELEQLYRQAEVGAMPQGYLRGRAIYCPDKALSGARSAVTHVLWHGKEFHADCTLINQWCGFKAIRARVYPGPSWLDGGPSLIMDYCGTSRVWADVRDELREVAPGLYLGAMYRRREPEPEFKMFFALEAGDRGTCCP